MPGFEHQHPRASSGHRAEHGALNASTAQPRMRDGKFTDKPVDEAAGGLSALGADDQAQAEVAELLTPYGLELQDVPLGADGVSLAEHWARLREQAGAPLPDSVTDVVEAHLGIEDYGRLRGEPRLVWLAPDEDGMDWRDAAWDGVEVQAGDARWDDPDAALAWRVHTRNGGGNRECWDDDHDLFRGASSKGSRATRPQPPTRYRADHIGAPDGADALSAVTCASQAADRASA